MSGTGKTLTSGEFSQRTGIPVSTITKMLRNGTIQGEKRGGKWAIDENEINNAAVRSKMEGDHLSSGKVPEAASSSANQPSYDIKTFADLTYLTENGVRAWYRSGRLDGSVDDEGRIRIDAANLHKPALRHLLR